jgi:hypothetical protein
MSNKNVKGQKISKKEAKTIVYNKLAEALSDYRQEIKPKKFEAKLKKASKLFSTDIAKAADKANPEKKVKTKIKAGKKHTEQAAS